MDFLKNLALALHNDEDGATATEYIILLVLVACFIIAIVSLFGEAIHDLFSDATDSLNEMEVTTPQTGGG